MAAVGGPAFGVGAVPPPPDYQVAVPAGAALAPATCDPAAATNVPPGGLAPESIKSGTVTSWSDETGTGTISLIESGLDVFVQRTALTDGNSLAKDSLVTFELGFDPATKRPIAKMCVGAVTATLAARSGSLGTSFTEPVPGTATPGLGPGVGGGLPNVVAPVPGVPEAAPAASGGMRAVDPEPAAPMLPPPALPPPAAPPTASQQQTWAAQAPGAPAALGDAPPPPPPDESAHTSDNLFICGLPSTCTEESVKQVFSAYGMVVSVKVLPDKGKPDRAALVRMSDSAIAQWLVEHVHNNIPVGLATPITVRYAQKSASTTPTGETMTGTVRIWLEERGMGFIVPTAGGEDYFVHRSNLCDGHSLVQGATVSFDPAWDVQKSKPVAKKVVGAVPNPALVALGMSYGSGGKGAIAAQQAAAVGGAAAAGKKSGYVKIWFEEKGFGFLAPDDGSGDAFIHRTSIQDGSSLIQGSAVTYMAEWDAGKGRFIARDCYSVTQSAAVTQIGTVKIWFEEKGYGFLSADDGSGDAFVHRSSLIEGNALAPGDQVQYEANWDATKSKFIATKALVISGGGAAQAAGMAGPGTEQTSDCIVISGLPADCTEDAVRRIFSPYGSLEEIRLLGGGSAWVRLAQAAQAVWMCSNLHGNMPVGLDSPISVQLAAPNAEYGKAPGLAALTDAARAAPY